MDTDQPRTPHTNTPIEGHPLLGKRFTYRPDLPVYDPATDDEDGTLIVGPGMTVIVRFVYRDWNGVAGLDMLYVGCEETGYSTHVTPADLGLPPLTAYKMPGAGATGSTEPIRLGVPEVTDLLRTIVAEKGPEYVYPYEDQMCAYTETVDDEGPGGGALVPSCLVGHLLVRAGVPIEKVASVEGRHAADVLDTLEYRGEVDLPSDDDARVTLLDALDQAQEAQDAGESWGEVLAEYEDAMGLLPKPEPEAGATGSTDDEPLPSLLDRLAAAFKEAWHEADERGEVGHRTKYGIAAVLAEMGGTLPPALWYIPEPEAGATGSTRPNPAEVKEYVFEPRGTMPDRRYAGKRIVRMEPMSEAVYDRDEVGPMFLAYFEDGHRIHVFEDEVQGRTGQVAQEKVLAGEPTSPDPYAHPLDCLFCNAGEPMNHLYEPPAKD